MTTQTTTTADNSNYVFTPRELQRLAVYRAAIAAHFYTDNCERPASQASRQPMIGCAAGLRSSAAHAPVA